MMQVAFDCLCDDTRAASQMRQRLGGISVKPISQAQMFTLSKENNVPMFILELYFEHAYPEPRDKTRGCPASTGIFELYNFCDDVEVPSGVARIVATPFVRPSFKHVSAAIFRLR